MHTVSRGPAAAMGGALVLLALLTVVDGLGLTGWLVGTIAAGAANVLVIGALDRHGVAKLQLPNRITLVRAMLGCGAAALVADSMLDPDRHTTAIVVVATVALVLDAVDGYVARRTNAVTALGGRFDMEVDAFLIAVLSCYAIPVVGGWVSAIGAARYAYWLAGRAWPALRVPVPPRYWRKVVAAIQGIVLTGVAAQLLPLPVEAVLVAVALALLTESFGRDVLWQARGGRARRLRRGDRAGLALAGSR